MPRSKNNYKSRQERVLARVKAKERARDIPVPATVEQDWGLPMRALPATPSTPAKAKEKFPNIYTEESFASLTTYRENIKILKGFGLHPQDVVIDCGFHRGEELQYLNAVGCRVFAFEVHPDHFENVLQIYKDNDRITLYNEAVWHADGRIEVYYKKGSPLGSMSAERGKINVDKKKSIEVPATDLARFIQDLGVRISLVKMDVEGSEYRIIERLIDTGAIDLVDRMCYEDHEKKIKDKTWSSRKKKVKKMMKKCRTKFFKWE